VSLARAVCRLEDISLGFGRIYPFCVYGDDGGGGGGGDDGEHRSKPRRYAMPDQKSSQDDKVNSKVTCRRDAGGDGGLLRGACLVFLLSCFTTS
jgi:hypothetical protein